MYWVLEFAQIVLFCQNLNKHFRMTKQISYIFSSILLIFGFIIDLSAQEISNVRVGYINEIKRFEVSFDLEFQVQQPVDLDVYIQQFPNGNRRKIESSLIHGLNLHGLFPGYSNYFQIDAKDLNLLPTEYVFEIIPVKLKSASEFKSEITSVNLTTASEFKSDSISNKNLHDKLNEQKYKVKKAIKQSLKFISLGVRPFSLGGEQTNSTIVGIFGIIRDGIGYGLSLSYGLSSHPTTGLIASNDEIINYTKTNSMYKFTEEKRTTRLSIIPTFLIGIRDYLYLSSGIGFGSRSLYWSADEIDFNGSKTGTIWAQNSFASLSGVEFQSGLNFIYKKIHISSGINYLGIFKPANSKAYSDAWIGFGLNF